MLSNCVAKGCFLMTIGFLIAVCAALLVAWFFVVFAQPECLPEQTYFQGGCYSPMPFPEREYQVFLPIILTEE